ncbi:DUF2189 domain-containing protein [Roseococcus sp. YIM B11640]|uniref:DUF2189 domain-containing protein n=1 Tax=Roseococcus sp. YIM B11640 TaxID=3133973 RepID=UPI003C79A83B
MAQLVRGAYGAHDTQLHINRIGAADLREALMRGFGDFMAAPTQIFFLCLIYPVFGYVIARAAAGGALLPLVWPLLAGFALIGPVAALGLYELSRRREQGLPISWRNMFDVRHSPSIGGIVALGVILVAIFAIWIGVARLMFHAFIGPVLPGSFSMLLDQIQQAPGGMTLVVLGNLVGAGFALLVLALSVISFPAMLDRQMTAGEAMSLSLAAFRANPGTIMAWGVMVALLLAAGMATLFVGLAVALPVLGHATWHLYRKLVG